MSEKEPRKEEMLRVIREAQSIFGMKDLFEKEAKLKGYWKGCSDILEFVCHLIQNQPEVDGIWCPRCGEVFHDKDMINNPEKYWTCKRCGTIQHVKCRGLIEDENQPEVDEEFIEKWTFKLGTEYEFVRRQHLINMLKEISVRIKESK